MAVPQDPKTAEPSRGKSNRNQIAISVAVLVGLVGVYAVIATYDSPISHSTITLTVTKVIRNGNNFDVIGTTETGAQASISNGHFYPNGNYSNSDSLSVGKTYHLECTRFANAYEDYSDCNYAG